MGLANKNGKVSPKGLSGFQKLTGLLFGLLLCLLVFSCTTKKTKSDIEIEFVQDTLNVGYTYWWSESGPFIGQCGDELSLVFLGKVVDLKTATDAAGPLYTSKKGVIEIEHVYKIKDLGGNHYANQKFVTTDCFQGLDLNIDDAVLVVCYDYEDDYTIPGGKSILKVSGLDDPLVTSVRRYIDTDQNALKLKKDIGLWAKEGLGRKLQEIIECANEMDSGATLNSLDIQ